MKHEISHQGNNTPDYTKESSLLGEFTHDRSCKKNVFFSVNIRTKKQMRIPSDTVLKVRPSNIAVTAFFHGLDVQVVPTHQIHSAAQPPGFSFTDGFEITVCYFIQM